LVEPNSAILWAGDYLLDHPDCETSHLIQLATASPSEVETVRRALHALTEGESEDNRLRAVRRWRYLFLRDFKRSSSDLPVALERVYADFDYLPDLAHLIYYMPGKITTYDGKDFFEVHLWDELQAFLRTEIRDLI
jgi:hypothetical protein